MFLYFQTANKHNYLQKMFLVDITRKVFLLLLFIITNVISRNPPHSNIDSCGRNTKKSYCKIGRLFFFGCNVLQNMSNLRKLLPLATLFSHMWPRFCGGDIYSRRKPLFSSFGEHTAVCGSSVRQAVARPRHRQSVCIHNIHVAATCRPSVLGSATKTRPHVVEQSGQCARALIVTIVSCSNPFILYIKAHLQSYYLSLISMNSYY